MKTKIRLKMKSKIVAAIIFITVVFPGILMATEPKNDILINEGSYYSQANIVVDSWMFDLSSWVIKSDANMTEREEAFSVEKWMLKPDHRSWGNFSGEESIQLEKWMVDIQYSDWDNCQSEPEQILENWMYDLASWSKS